MEQNIVSALTNITNEVSQAAHEPIIVLMAVLVLAVAAGAVTMYRKFNDEARKERIAATYGPPPDSQFRPIDY